MSAGTDKNKPPKMTELPRNIEELKRYSRQERQEITDRLRKVPLEISDQAFARNGRMLRTLIDDKTALTWGEGKSYRR